MSSTIDPSGLQALILIGFVLGLLVVICWILLPFAVFGIKPLLRELIEETRRSRKLAGNARPKGGTEIVKLPGRLDEFIAPRWTHD